jgi:hypothetical protein
MVVQMNEGQTYYLLHALLMPYMSFVDRDIRDFLAIIPRLA